MEQVSYRVHVRIVSAFCSLFPRPEIRRFIEKSLLLGSIIQLLILCALHYLYISSQLQDSNLLTKAFVATVQYSNLSLAWPPMLHVPAVMSPMLQPYLPYLWASTDALLHHISPLQSSNCLLNAIRDTGVLAALNLTTTEELLRRLPLLRINIADPYARKESQQGAALASAVQMQSALPDAVRGLYRSSRGHRGDALLPPFSLSSALPSASFGGCDGEIAARGEKSPGDVLPRDRCVDNPLITNVYLFSMHRGHLFLPQHAREEHGIRALDLLIAVDDGCFGPPLAATILRKLIGYDTVLVHWGLGAFGQKGYLYNSLSKQLFDLSMSAPTIIAGPGGWGWEGGSNATAGASVERNRGSGSSRSNSSRGSGSSGGGSDVLLGRDLHLAPFSLKSVSFKLGALVTACFLFFATSK